MILCSCLLSGKSIEMISSFRRHACEKLNKEKLRKPLDKSPGIGYNQ